MKISIVLLAFKESDDLFFQQMNAIASQIHLPNEVILIDASKNKKFESMFLSLDTHFSKKYISCPGSFPGQSRNVGAKKAVNEDIAFLDMKTIPKKYWLKEAIESMNFYRANYVFGCTTFKSDNSFQKLYQYCTYGNASHETLPGTVIKKSYFYQVGEFIPTARAAEDIEWRDRIKASNIIAIPNEPLLVYKELPRTFFDLIVKYIRNSFYGARLDVLKNIKEAYLSLFVVLIFLLIPRWNYLLTDWDKSPFYIDDITKKIYFSLLMIFVGYYFLNRIFLRSRNSNFLMILKYLSYLIIFYCVFRWNDLLGGISLLVSLYVPHITKTFLCILLAASIINRGIIIPLNNNVKPASLFPIYWFKVGMLGCMLDILKAPIYIFGSFIAILRR